jgi:hypothetical protein
VDPSCCFAANFTFRFRTPGVSFIVLVEALKG